jgi:hypothetical protein
MRTTLRRRMGAVNVKRRALWLSILQRVALQSELSWFMYNVDHSQIVYVYLVQY